MPEPSSETLRFERRGPVGWLVLHRPERLNAFTAQMWDELGALGRDVGEDPDLRALVVVGAGRAFSSGIDTSVFTTPAEDVVGRDGNRRHPDPFVARILDLQDSFTWLEEAPYPTVAAIRGYALGAGLQLALACDVRVVGPSKALQLIVTAARIDTAEAARLGLADVVVADDELERAAAALAETIAAQPPLAVQGAKRAVRAAVSGRSVRDGLLVEAEAQAACLRSRDMAEAIAAFVEQRAPVYRGT